MVLFLKKIFGSRNDRVLRTLQKRIDAINQLEPAMQALSNEALRAKTNEFKERLSKGETLDDLLPEAFAVVRETSVRTLQMRHFDVQLIGGMVLHAGNISEMKTGEGKTLVATLPAYLNALTGQGVHIVTVNDYLAQRDADWMRPVYEFLGLTVGVNKTLSHPAEKKLAYAADITYGTNNEFGFDYLRDNMAFSEEEQVQRSLNFAIVDEVDSILIDEARTPLIISGPAEESPENYIKINTLIPKLVKRIEENGPGDYYLEEKTRQAFLTEAGHEKVEKLLTEAGLLKNHDSLYGPANIQLVHHISAALRAHALYHKDVDYVVSNGEVVIVDEHTGRLMIGRRWSDGLHQSIEAKEGVKIQSENQTMASITFQNYFRLYKKLAGMTGTADTEAYEFQHIYGLEVIAIPTNQPMIREDQTDRIYVKTPIKYKKIIEDIQECRARQQPVLVGTIAIETSEYLSDLLNKAKIPHQVLNAKYHEKEAKIVAEAGRPGGVTIATNMAGRGTDIVLGGSLDAEFASLPADVSPEKRQALKEDWKKRHEQVVAAGGLRIIGTERHESRRIDNQLRGRSGRQGDPGSSRFYLSLEDNLMRIFASDRVGAIMQRGLQEDEALESGLIHKIIEYAQRKVEGHNFDVRKQLLEYDDVANEQRKVIYEQRSELLKTTDVSDTIQAILQDVADQVVSLHVAPGSMEEQWDISGLEQQLQGDFGIVLHLQSWLEADETRQEDALRQHVSEAMIKQYQAKEDMIGSEVMRQLEKSVMLQCLDTRWREHLVLMDYLRQGIHLRGYAQKNPKEEYKREAFNLFSTMLDTIKLDIIGVLYRLQIDTEAEIAEAEENRRKIAENRKVEYSHAHANALAAEEEEGPSAEENVVPFVRDQPKIGRNEACPCGSGKKYKYCHGRIS